MRSPTHPLRSFTLIEMLVVMAVIAILVAILLNLNGLVQSKAARARAEGEIKALSTGCDSYKADNGSYPQDTAKTDSLDPRSNGDPTSSAYKDASLFLYKKLSGDENADGRNDPSTETKSYLSDFFTPQRLAVSSTTIVGSPGYVNYLKDPYGNCYGYSTKGTAEEQKYRVKVSTDPTATRTAGVGYNPTFDLWSTAGKTSSPTPGVVGDVTNVWVKNW